MNESREIKNLKEILRLSIEFCKHDSNHISHGFIKINQLAYQLLKEIERTPPQPIEQ